jgi:hypothetical protein
MPRLVRLRSREISVEHDLESPDLSSLPTNGAGAVASPTIIRDKDVFTIPPSTAGLGFKCATLIGRLISDNSSVFVKLGESYQDCNFAEACSALRRDLGMTHTTFTIQWLLPTYDYAEVAARGNPGVWGDGVEKRIGRAKRDYADSNGRLPVQLVGVFEGKRVSDATTENVNGWELLQVLIFRKFVGSADTNAFNMMVDSEGRVLSVDETRASAQQLVKYANKGLITSQNIRQDLLAKAAEVMWKNPRKVGEFLERLRNLTMPETISDGGRLSNVHARAPFDDKTLNLLRGENQDALSMSALMRALRLPVPVAGSRKRGRED